jgi:uncharacterized damage-inducible protein DinB
MSTIQAILNEMEREAVATRKLLERVPEDKLDWRPHPKSFTLGQLALHIAQIPGRVSQMAALDVFEVRPFDRPQAQSRQELLDTFQQSLATARQVVVGMDEQKLAAPWSLDANGMTLMTIPRGVMMRTILLNHYYHHRGQLSVYLRLLDVPIPSIYGPSADENPFG